MVEESTCRVRRPLEAYSILRTPDLDEACAGVAGVLSPHDLRITRRGDSLDTELCHVSLGEVSINRLRYGATVDIDVGCTKDFLLVMMPLAGSSDIRCGDAAMRSSPGLASVVSPTLPLRMRSADGADQIMVRIDRTLVERQCMQYLGRELRRPIEFALGMDLTGSTGQSWSGLIKYLVEELDRDAGVLSSPLARSQLQHLIVTTLLLAQPHHYRDDLMRPAQAIAPHFVRRAEEYIAAHADEPLTIGDLAAHVSVSASALFAGFREFRNTSPMAHLRHTRLQRVHAELLAGGCGEITVTETALRWGFTHLGRFASDYRRLFGESPSTTLKNRTPA